jgi:hypothetical protein
MLVGGLSALMVGYALGGVLTTTTVLDFLLPHVAVPVNITTNNDGPVRATPMGPSVETPAGTKPASAPPGNFVLQVAAVVREDHARALANRPLKNWVERVNFPFQADRFWVVILFRASFRALACSSWPLQRHAETPRPGLTARETRQPSGFACAPGCRQHTRT